MGFVPGGGRSGVYTKCCIVGLFSELGSSRSESEYHVQRKRGQDAGERSYAQQCGCERCCKIALMEGMEGL